MFLCARPGITGSTVFVQLFQTAIKVISDPNFKLYLGCRMHILPQNFAMAEFPYSIVLSEFCGKWTMGPHRQSK